MARLVSTAVLVLSLLTCFLASGQKPWLGSTDPAPETCPTRQSDDPTNNPNFLLSMAENTPLPSILSKLGHKDRGYILANQKRIAEEEKAKENMSANEQTFIAIKPDGVQRGLVGEIISRFEKRGFKLVALKLVSPSKEHLEKHYADLSDKPFFKGLVTYMNSGPIAAMVWEGREACKTGRMILGATNPLASAPGTIRGDYAIDVGRNVCHGSDGVESAKKEIALWFKPEEVLSWKSAQFDWVYEKP